MLAALALWREAIAHQDLTDELGRKIRRTLATGDPRFLRDDGGAALVGARLVAVLSQLKLKLEQTLRSAKLEGRDSRAPALAPACKSPSTVQVLPAVEIGVEIPVPSGHEKLGVEMNAKGRARQYAVSPTRSACERAEPHYREVGNMAESSRELNGLPSLRSAPGRSRLSSTNHPLSGARLRARPPPRNARRDRSGEFEFHPRAPMSRTGLGQGR